MARGRPMNYAHLAGDSDDDFVGDTYGKKKKKVKKKPKKDTVAAKRTRSNPDGGLDEEELLLQKALELSRLEHENSQNSQQNQPDPDNTTCNNTREEATATEEVIELGDVDVEAAQAEYEATLVDYPSDNMGKSTNNDEANPHAVDEAASGSAPTSSDGSTSRRKKKKAFEVAPDSSSDYDPEEDAAPVESEDNEDDDFVIEPKPKKKAKKAKAKKSPKKSPKGKTKKTASKKRKAEPEPDNSSAIEPAEKSSKSDTVGTTAVPDCAIVDALATAGSAQADSTPATTSSSLTSEKTPASNNASSTKKSEPPSPGKKTKKKKVAPEEPTRPVFVSSAKTSKFGGGDKPAVLLTSGYNAQYGLGGVKLASPPMRYRTGLSKRVKVKPLLPRAANTQA